MRLGGRQVKISPARALTASQQMLTHNTLVISHREGMAALTLGAGPHRGPHPKDTEYRGKSLLGCWIGSSGSGVVPVQEGHLRHELLREAR